MNAPTPKVEGFMLTDTTHADAVERAYADGQQAVKLKRAGLPWKALHDVNINALTHRDVQRSFWRGVDDA